MIFLTSQAVHHRWLSPVCTTHSSRPRIERIASVNSARCTSIAWSANTQWRTRRGRAKGPRGRRGCGWRGGSRDGLVGICCCDLENCHFLFMLNVFLINQHTKWPFSIANCWSYQRVSDHNGTKNNEGGNESKWFQDDVWATIKWARCGSKMMFDQPKNEHTVARNTSDCGYIRICIETLEWLWPT
jgi:hypothetical protein